MTDQLHEELYGDDIRALQCHRFTERQARFLVTVLVHAGVFVERQYCTFAGIAHGQKTHDFLEHLAARRFATSIAVGALHRGRLWHVHSKTLYAAIGEPNNRHRRQAPIGRLIERVMLLDAVLADPTHVWLGTEHDKLAYFTLWQQTNLHREELPHLTFRREDCETVRSFPDKLPIGVPPDGLRHVFLYLVTRDTPWDFRLFLLRQAELLRCLPAFTLRLLFPPALTRAAPRYREAVREQLASPLHPRVVDELRTLFERRLWHRHHPAAPVEPAFVEASRHFRGPRFQALARQWEQDGEAAVLAALSPTLRDAFETGRGRLECVELTRQYLHLTGLVGVA